MYKRETYQIPIHYINQHDYAFYKIGIPIAYMTFSEKKKERNIIEIIFSFKIFCRLITSLFN